MHILVLINKSLLFFIDALNLLNQELSSCPLIVLILLPRKSLICFEKLPFCLMNHMLKLFSMSLQLHFVSRSLLLEVKVFLQELIPSSLTLVLPLGHLFDDAPVFDILGRQVFQKLCEHGLLLGRIAGTRYLLKCDLDILF